MIELISTHIPKTAGTAFSSLLKCIYPGQALLLDYGDRIFSPISRFQSDFSAWNQDSENYLDGLSPTLRAVHGHFWLGKYARRFPTARRIVWLRNPVQLLISLYFYWKTTPDFGNPTCKHLLEGNLTLSQFAALPELHNMVTDKTLKGYEVSDLDFVGIQEFFAQDMARLCQLMSWPCQTAPVANKTLSEEYMRFQAGSDLIKTISDYNAADIQFYYQALARRDAWKSG